MIIEYLGKTLNTEHYVPLTDEQYQQCVDEFYAKPDFNDNDELCYVFQEKEYVNEKN